MSGEKWTNLAARARDAVDVCPAAAAARLRDDVDVVVLTESFSRPPYICGHLSRTPDRWADTHETALCCSRCRFIRGATCWLPPPDVRRDVLVFGFEVGGDEDGEKRTGNELA